MQQQEGSEGVVAEPRQSSNDRQQACASVLHQHERRQRARVLCALDCLADCLHGLGLVPPLAARPRGIQLPQHLWSQLVVVLVAQQASQRVLVLPPNLGLVPAGGGRGGGTW